ncbi:MAG: type II secretion system F family protein [Planctomycetales bacterium]|nr:type II secretion system F family protein [Planctomycetales bacterium]
MNVADWFQAGLLLGGFGVCLLTAVHIAYQARRRSADELSLTFRFIAWLAILVGFGAPTAVAIPQLVWQMLELPSGFGLGRLPIGEEGLFVFVVLGTLLATGAFLATVWSQAHHNRMRGLLWSIAAADKSGLPLSTAPRAMAWSRNDRFGAYCDRVADRLEHGEPLTIALRIANPDAFLALRLGTLHGNLHDSIQRWLQRDATRQPPPWLRYGYFAAFVTFALGMTLVLLANLAMTFDYILREASQASLLLQWLTAMENATGKWLLLLPLATMLAMGVILLHQLGLLQHRKPFSTLSYPADRVRVLRALSLATDANAPIGQTLGLLANEFPRRHMRIRMAMVATDHEAGLSWIDSLCHQLVITAAEAELLRSAQRLGNLPWALDELADRRIRRLESRVRLFDTFFVPLATLAIGAAVGLLGFAMFSDFSKLIHASIP